jgi:hypothetical protein
VSATSRQGELKEKMELARLERLRSEDPSEASRLAAAASPPVDDDALAMSAEFAHAIETDSYTLGSERIAEEELLNMQPSLVSRSASSSSPKKRPPAPPLGWTGSPLPPSVPSVSTLLASLFAPSSSPLPPTPPLTHTNSAPAYLALCLDPRKDSSFFSTAAREIASVPFSSPNMAQTSVLLVSPSSPGSMRKLAKVVDKQRGGSGQSQKLADGKLGAGVCVATTDAGADKGGVRASQPQLLFEQLGLSGGGRILSMAVVVLDIASGTVKLVAGKQDGLLSAGSLEDLVDKALKS